MSASVTESETKYLFLLNNNYTRISKARSESYFKISKHAVDLFVVAFRRSWNLVSDQ